MSLFKYIYLTYYYRENQNLINAKALGFGASPVRIKCLERSFPSMKELRIAAIAIEKVNGTNHISELVILSFEELSIEKLGCLFPMISFEENVATNIVI